MMSAELVGRHYLDDLRAQVQRLKDLADRALARVSDQEFFHQLDPESNSLALIVKHLAGNTRSRWTDFLTSDGEKPDRRRDAEFEVEPGDTRPALMAHWEESWQILFETLGALRPEDLLKTVFIRGEPLTALQAIDRAFSHLAYHVGQIVFLAKHFRHAAWESLTIPRGRSADASRPATDRRRELPG